MHSTSNMRKIFILFLLVVLQAQSHAVNGEWKPDTWIDDNVEISTEEEYLCQGLSPDDTRICKVIINNFLSTMFKSRNIGSQNINPPGNHSRYIPIFIRITDHEMELKSRQEYNDALLNANRREIEAQTRLEFALQRENELKSKLQLCNRENEIRLEVARNLQNQTDFKLIETQQKLNKIVISELRLQFSLEHLNQSLSKCEQEFTNITSQLHSTTTRETEAKIRLETIQENTHQTIKNCQLQLRDVDSQLAVVKTNESWTRTQLQQDWLLEKSNFSKQLEAMELTLNLCKIVESKAEHNRRELVDQLTECKQSVQNASLQNNNLQILLNNKNAELQNCSSEKQIPVGAVALATGFYYFYNVRISWSEARDFCISKGMDLVSVESEEENQAIVQYALRLGGRISDWAHTSGCYSNQVQGFVWQNTKQPLSFSKWATGQPDDKSESSCIQIRVNSNGIWHDYSINRQTEPVICELMP